MNKSIIYLIASIVLVFTSCSKNDLKPDINSIVGTYQGTINHSSDNSSSSATTDITEDGEYSVNVHCYSDDFDTSFVMDLYQDGNTVYCNNGGYSDNSGHMDNMNQHCNTEEHHGSFDMDNNSFNYTFDDANGVSDFEGKKK